MKLVNCPACSAEVSPKADNCPKCGQPMPRNVAIRNATIVGLLAVIVAIVIGRAVANADPYDASRGPMAIAAVVIMVCGVGHYVFVRVRIAVEDRR